MFGRLRGMGHSVPHGKVVFEVGGGGIREEIAKEGTFVALRQPNTRLFRFDRAHRPVLPLLTLALFTALRLASAKLPGPTEFISTSTPPRLGNIANANAPTPSNPLTTSSLLSAGKLRPEILAAPVQAAVNAAGSIRAKSTFAGAVRQDPMTGEVISLPDLDVSSRVGLSSPT